MHNRTACYRLSTSAVRAGSSWRREELCYAIRSGDERQGLRLRLFLYPKSLACITPENKDYYDAMASHIAELIPPNYTFSLLPVNEGNLKALESMGQRWTVKPAAGTAHRLSAGQRRGRLRRVLDPRERALVYDLPCATDAAIKQYRDNAAAVNEAALARYKALASEIKEPLRSGTPGLASSAQNRHRHRPLPSSDRTGLQDFNVCDERAENGSALRQKHATFTIVACGPSSSGSY